jgi:hypothetical protein
MRETLMTAGGLLPPSLPPMRRALLQVHPLTPIRRRLDLLPTHTLTALCRVVINLFVSVTTIRPASHTALALALSRMVLKYHHPALLYTLHTSRKIKHTGILARRPSHELIRTTPLNPICIP